MIREGHLAHSGEKRNTCRVCVGKPLQKNKTLGKPRNKCEDSKMDLKVVGWEGVDWINAAQDRDMWRTLLLAVINFLTP